MLKKILGFFSSYEGEEQERFPSKNEGSMSSRRSPVFSENVKDDFKDKHFEYFGDMWDALLGDVSRLESMLEKIVQNGELRPNCRVVGKKDKAQMLLIQYPRESEIRAGAFLAEAEAGEGLRLASCYPVLEGLPNRLMIKATYTWSNGMEGDVTAYGIGDYPLMAFHAPFFFRDSQKFVPDSELVVELGALALSLEQAKPQAPGLFPTKHACEWKFQSSILAVKPVAFLKTQLYRMTIVFISVDGQAISGYLYASQHVLQGYVPKVGDDVEGVLWMTGFLGKTISGEP